MMMMMQSKKMSCRLAYIKAWPIPKSSSTPKTKATTTTTTT
jgi:hypothetical protein